MAAIGADEVKECGFAFQPADGFGEDDHAVGEIDFADGLAVVGEFEAALPALFDDVLALARVSRATVYTIGIYDESDADRNPGVLRKIAKATGGRPYSVKNPNQLPAIYIKETRLVSQSFVHDKPFRPVVVNHTWLTATVTAFAQSVYEEGAFERLPILADALEEAGCTNLDILGHCRQPGEHVRGCWAVDLLLGKL